MPLAFKGKHTKFKGIDLYTARKVQVFSDEKLPIHCDGEYAGVEDEFVVTLCSKQVRVIVR